ncbi:hypothetical protein [Nonomuraea sp. NPDC048916]|uniref:hypothetical protein n=1 Tax=Nonomuraea sp. NPDC048916 TaxID=3154232 RepID=UPI00340ECDA5
MIRPLGGTDMSGGPLGQGERIRHRAVVVPVTSLALGFLASAFVIMSTASVVGRAFGAALLPETFRLWSAVVLCVALCAFDVASLRARGMCRVTWRRQTPKNLLYQYGPRTGPFLWGLDTGLAVTTFRVSAATWGVLGLAVLQVAPWWTGVAYALGFALPLAIATMVPRWDPPREPGWVSMGLSKRHAIGQFATLAALVSLLVPLLLTVLP